MCASTLHPVFFTQRLQKPIAPVVSSPHGLGSNSPVAHGYVYQEALAAGNQGSKL